VSEPTSSTRRQQGRSPAYPGIALDIALVRTEAIYQHEHRHRVPVQVVQEHCNLKPGSGPANVAVAALKRFGLLADEGVGDKRRVWLTELAVEILLSKDDPIRRLELIRHAALLPEIHKEMWDQYGGQLPSDATLRRELVLSRGFTDSGAVEFMRELRQTLSFAQLVGEPDQPGRTNVSETDRGGSDHGSQKEGSMPMHSPTPATSPSSDYFSDLFAGSGADPKQPTSPPPATHVPPSPPAPGGGVTITILMPGGTPVYITGHFPISEAAWRQLIKVLEAMKDGMVTE
jgi:hypothetical protein